MMHLNKINQLNLDQNIIKKNLMKENKGNSKNWLLKLKKHVLLIDIK